MVRANRAIEVNICIHKSGKCEWQTKQNEKKRRKYLIYCKRRVSEIIFT